MADTIETIQYINLGDNEKHPIDAVQFGSKTYSEMKSDVQSGLQVNNLVTEINKDSDDTHYPSAKCMWTIVGDVETLLSKI